MNFAQPESNPTDQFCNIDARAKIWSIAPRLLTEWYGKMGPMGPMMRGMQAASAACGMAVDG
jgi:hypothetical protein